MAGNAGINLCGVCLHFGGTYKHDALPSAAAAPALTSYRLRPPSVESRGRARGIHREPALRDPESGYRLECGDTARARRQADEAFFTTPATLGRGAASGIRDVHPSCGVSPHLRGDVRARLVSVVSVQDRGPDALRRSALRGADTTASQGCTAIPHANALAQGQVFAAKAVAHRRPSVA